MTNPKKSVHSGPNDFHSHDQSGWSNAERDSWVTMAMAAATKSLRALNIEDAVAKSEVRDGKK